MLLHWNDFSDLFNAVADLASGGNTSSTKFAEVSRRLLGVPRSYSTTHVALYIMFVHNCNRLTKDSMNCCTGMEEGGVRGTQIALVFLMHGRAVFVSLTMFRQARPEYQPFEFLAGKLLKRLMALLVSPANNAALYILCVLDTDPPSAVLVSQPPNMYS